MASHIRSSIIERKSFYLKVGQSGNTQIKNHLDQTSEIESKCFYREVYDEQQRSKEHDEAQLFKDAQYNINLGEQFPEKEHTILLKRLSTMYGKIKPHFIDIKQNPTKLNYTEGLPIFLHQLSLYSTEHYRGFFITQQFSKTGKYVLIICIDGKFETICVDDYIPINKQTLLPIWGLSFDRPWELILIKAWAKHKGGYQQLFQTKPFEFTQSFTNPTWKYYNLIREEKNFLSIYSNKDRLSKAKIILKTKSDPKVNHYGLKNNSAGFQIIDICKHGQQYVIAVRGTLKHKWTGSMSYIDKNIIQYYRQHHQQKLNLDRDFLINQKDLNLLFSAAYISAKRQMDFFTGSKLIQIEKNQKNTHYYELIISHEGFFDFSFKQFEDNKIQDKADSKNDEKRYLRSFFALVRDNDYKIQEKDNELGKSHFRNRDIAVSKLGSTLKTLNFKSTRFTHYQMEYNKGYNRGDAKFLSVEPGRYILRFKSQFTDKLAKYQFNWVSNSIIKPKQLIFKQEDGDQLLHEAFTSLIHSYPHYFIRKNQRDQIATYGQSFDHVKYGFCGVRSSLNSNCTILVACDPKKLSEQGYLLKGKYKHQKQPFVVKVQPGQFETIIFKKNFQSQKYLWPIHSINIFKQNQPDQQQKQKQDILSSNTHPIQKDKVKKEDQQFQGENAQH